MSFLRSGGQENTEEDYTKGLIVSFTAKRIGGEDETEKAAEATEKVADETEKAAEAAEKVAEETAGEETEKVAEEKAANTEGGDEGDKLSREDLKSALVKFGIIRVCLPSIHILQSFMHNL